jgi:predicted ArsR family transcriptional regulator
MRKNRFDGAEIPLTGDSFVRRLLNELTDVLQDVIGFEEARGFIAIVGARIGDVFNDAYTTAVGRRSLERAEVADAMVDLKRRIGGGFQVAEQSDREILLENSCCPFGPSVRGRPTLCMMTSNVFGRIAAENLGYAKVIIEEAIANGDNRCLVRVVLDSAQGDEITGGREYFRVGSQTEAGGSAAPGSES